MFAADKPKVVMGMAPPLSFSSPSRGPRQLFCIQSDSLRFFGIFETFLLVFAGWELGGVTVRRQDDNNDNKIQQMTHLLVEK